MVPEKIPSERMFKWRPNRYLISPLVCRRFSKEKGRQVLLPPLYLSPEPPNNPRYSRDACRGEEHKNSRRTNKTAGDVLLFIHSYHPLGVLYHSGAFMGCALPLLSSRYETAGILIQGARLIYPPPPARFFLLITQNIRTEQLLLKSAHDVLRCGPPVRCLI